MKDLFKLIIITFALLILFQICYYLILYPIIDYYMVITIIGIIILFIIFIIFNISLELFMRLFKLTTNKNNGD